MFDFSLVMGQNLVQKKSILVHVGTADTALQTERLTLIGECCTK